MPAVCAVHTRAQACQGDAGLPGTCRHAARTTELRRGMPMGRGQHRAQQQLHTHLQSMVHRAQKQEAVKTWHVCARLTCSFLAA